jgi:nucleoside-diphosphate-sugar epimerase
MKYFVTGATGFIGGELVRQLVAQGHEVIALVRSPEKATELKNLGVQLHQGDITDKESLRAPMTGVDGVFHLAAWYKIGGKDNHVARKINVDGTRHVLEMMRDLQIPKGVYTSTIGIFSDTHGNIPDESYRFNGPFLNEYERTKWSTHYEVAEPMIRAGLPLVIVMPGLVYGPGDPSLAGYSIALYLQRKLPMVPLKTTFCWGHVADTARGHILAMEKGTPGETYIITGPARTFIDIVKYGEQLTGIPGPKLYVPPALMKLSAAFVRLIENIVPLPDAYRSESLRINAGTTYVGSNAKAKRDLGFTIREPEEGLRELVEYELKRLNITPPKEISR